MLIRRLEDCDEFLAGDGTVLREYLHPGKTALSLRYSLAHATVKRGEVSLKHTLHYSEVYCILDGIGEMWIDGETRRVEEGDVVYIPPEATQCIRSVGDTDLRFLCIVDPAWRPECEEVERLE